MGCEKMNIWKVSFFLLVFLIIISVAGLVVWAIPLGEDKPIPARVSEEPNQVSVLTVETTVDDFERLALKYFEKELKNSKLPVDITVNEKIEMVSDLVVFGLNVPIAMKFDPIVNEDGNIILKQTEVNVGRLNIPPSTVLNLLDDAVKFPSWIVVRPKAEEIFVDLSNILISGSKVRAKEIDLENNRIKLEVTVPNE